jgi:CheY-like chemotaxis protein
VTNVAVASGAPLIVIADPDAEIRDTVHGFMSARGYRVEAAPDADTATSLLATGQVEVLICELAMTGRDGGELLAAARRVAPDTRRIAIASEATPRIREAGARLGAMRVLGKPLSLLELADAIRLAHDCAEGFHGWMHRMSLIDVLQMYHHAGQSLVVHIRAEPVLEGMIALRHGELIHAECGDRVGMPALVELLTARRGQLETAALDHGQRAPIQRTLVGPFDHVLLDGLRSLDEGRGAAAMSGAVVVTDDWLEEHVEADPLDEAALRAWLAEHAPGAGVWRVDPARADIARIDVTGANPEIELASPPGSLGWAYELAELADPTWQRVELTTGATAIALIRISGVVIAFARLIAGEAMQRRFHVESARLQRWLTDHIAAHALGAGGAS